MPQQICQRFVHIEGSQNRVIIRKVHTVSLLEEESMMMKVLCAIAGQV